MAKPPDKLLALVPPATLATHDEHGILIEIHAAARTVDGIRTTVKMANGRVGAYETITYTDGAERADLIAMVAGSDEEKAHYAQLLLDGGTQVESALREHEEAQGGAPTPSQSSVLVTLAADWELFHDASGEAFASFVVETGARQTHRLATRAVRDRLKFLYWTETGQGVRTQSVMDALGVLAGRAQYEGLEHAVYIRLAEHQGALYLDLGDATWGALCITRDGWDVVASTDLPVKFRRARGMLALPMPARGGTIEELRPFLNVPKDKALSDAWVLKVSWLIGSLSPSVPHPILNIEGEQGSAKSTEARVLRSCIDPNSAPLRSQPREERDLMIAAHNGWVVAFDNISELKPWLSDALCRLATGGGFATRELYADLDETLIDAQRPIIMDGIEAVGTRPDFLDRSLLVVQPVIPKGERMTEKRFWAAFDSARPRILGALLDAASCALRRRDEVCCDELPRMADFAIWATAAEPALGWPDGTMLSAYTSNRQDADALALQASILAGPIWTFTQTHSPWTGTATQLLAELNAGVDDATRVRRERNGWPKAPNVLSGMLTRITPNLREVGITITLSKSRGKGRLITIVRDERPTPPEGDQTTPPWEKEPQTIVPIVPIVPSSVNRGPGSAPPSSPPSSPPDQTSSPPGQQRPLFGQDHAWGDDGDDGDGGLHDRFPAQVHSSHGGAAPVDADAATCGGCGESIGAGGQLCADCGAALDAATSVGGVFDGDAVLDMECPI